MKKLLTTPWMLGIVGTLVMVSALARSAVPNPPSDASFLFLGDTLLADRGEVLMAEHGLSWPLAQLPNLGDPDLAFFNAEGPLTERNFIPPDAYYAEGSPVPRYDVTTSRGVVRRYVYRGAPAVAPVLRDLGMDVAVLSNNHVLDQGPEGLVDTQAALAATGIATIGGGLNATEAAAPHIYESEHGRVAFFSFGEVGGTAPEATAGSAGIRGLTSLNVDAAVQTARDIDADWTVAIVHWGNNYEPVLDTQEVWARRLKDRGFDLIVGHGPHLAQGITRLGNTPVLYSVGNFVFLSKGRYSPETPGFSLAATAILGPRGFREVQVTCLQTDNELIAYQTRACTDADAQVVLPKLAPGIVVNGAMGTLKW